RGLRHEPDGRVLHGLGLLQRSQPDQLRVARASARVRRQPFLQLPLSRNQGASAPGPELSLRASLSLAAASPPRASAGFSTICSLIGRYTEVYRPVTAA